MISIQKEETIRRLLSDGLTAHSIADQIKVSKVTVYAIKKASGLRERKSPRKKQKISINRKRLWEFRRCKKCGALLKIWPCVLCFPAANGPYKKEPTPKKMIEITAAESLELFHIVKDLQSLSKLHLIQNPLFTDLANRATKSLSRIENKGKKCHEKKHSH